MPNVWFRSSADVTTDHLPIGANLLRTLCHNSDVNNSVGAGRCHRLAAAFALFWTELGDNRQLYNVIYV